MNKQVLETMIRKTLTYLTDKDVSDIPLDQDLSEELGLDSLSRLELLSEVEEQLDVVIYEVDTGKALTIRGMIEICETAIAQNMESA